MTTGKPRKVIVIPARMDSGRLPGKAMADINGLPLVHKTYKAAMRTKANSVFVTAPDDEIEIYCSNHGIPFQRTDSNLTNGTQRCHQALVRLFGDSVSDLTTVVNWQVDEPLVDPTYVNRMLTSKLFVIHTLVSYKGIDFPTKNEVKVIVNDQCTRCHWFTRNAVLGAAFHCGVYSFPWFALEKTVLLVPSEKAVLESLEQLTWLEHGFSIKPIKMHIMPVGINTESDLEECRRLLR